MIFVTSPMKVYSFFILLFGLFLLESCRNNPSNSETIYSVHQMQGKDTLNRLTVNLSTLDSVRQGKWIPSKLNNLKDTVYYKDGVIIPK